MKNKLPSILILEASSDNVSLAGIINGSVQFVYNRRARFAASSLPAIINNKISEHKISLNDFDAVAVGKGPGSFTGLRVAYSVAKAFSTALNKPMIITDSLASCALSVKPDGERNVIINAYRGMVYSAIFKISGGLYTYIRKERLTTLEEAVKAGKDKIIVTYNDCIRTAITQKYPLTKVVSVDKYPKAAYLKDAVIAAYNNKEFADSDKCEPLYLHPKDCQVHKKK
ncbi:MAG: tRNA (adenosine(37)-N6)-threonylcarbamoyltransferase complex dimerization subunit type 1 TsaB [Candidatus Omnitrophica bacterium]|nr:tRNA (adenosine(37)-N6)-threonylcarbamoyltransferase complex dimerization subunit type 1 TsaB [Candidatus Omnitrophota bacterium]MDD5440997.1 tRNA (adenosine(37)-N6)-threonylcarbamoyltransferase complex dimerization subunit type 1 TsaB [Candidatus Omnitrophota bacterium]